MFSIPEQFSNATKANFEAQFAIFSALTNKAFEGVEKFVDLNLTAAKASLEESSATTKQLLSAKDHKNSFRWPVLRRSLMRKKPLLTAVIWQASLRAPALNSAKPLKPKSPKPTARLFRWLKK